MNLSNHTLTPPQIALLDKGLTFIPAFNTVPLQPVLDCRERNIRNLHLRDYFRHKSQDYDPKEFKNRFKHRSTWRPPPQGA